jgi:hypothetical protein
MGAAAHWEATGVEGDRDVSGGSPSLSSLFSLFSPEVFFNNLPLH